MYFSLYEDSMSNLLNFKYLFLISMMSNLLMSKIASQLSIKNFDIYFVTTSLLNFWFIQKLKYLKRNINHLWSIFVSKIPAWGYKISVISAYILYVCVLGTPVI